ncbi:MAG TPA: hypothetical protein VJ256_00120 [Dehalococcoidia bacterium]|nr:hypothetical protein [Dehalococcoidia bacterium]
MLHQVLNYIERYLIGRCSLRDLEIWLLSNLQTVLDSDDEAAIRVADEVDADLVWLGEGLIDEATLRERLQSYVELHGTISVGFYETERTATVHATTAVETVMGRLEVPEPVVTLRLHHEFA